MTRLRSATLLIASALSTAGAQTNNPLRDSIEARSRAFLMSSRTPGLAVGVWKDGKAVFAGGFGVTAVGGQQPVTSRTVFHLASISKTFVATAVMQLVEQGKVRLDDPVVKYVPYFAMKHPRSATITVRQVLSHTAGMPDVTDYAWDTPQYDDKALERWIRGLKDSTLVFEPGTDFRYSNIGFELLADLVAVVSGESFEGYVQRHILEPARMAHSTFLMTDVDSANLSTGHEMSGGVQTRRGFPYNRRHAGSSTMHSGVDDMLRYGVMHANKGSIDGKQILKRETYDLLWKTEYDLSERFAPRFAMSRATSSRPMTKASMGLGWFVYDFSGERAVNHDGGDRGYRSSLWIAPERRTVVVVFANSGANASELALSLLDLALGIRPLPPPKTIELTAPRKKN
jgi:CubicO group peptidase (beta-lactamase class C family)